MCQVNLALAHGYLEGLGLQQRLRVDLRPCPESCCVVLSPATS